MVFKMKHISVNVSFLYPFPSSLKNKEHSLKMRVSYIMKCIYYCKCSFLHFSQHFHFFFCLAFLVMHMWTIVLTSLSHVICILEVLL